MKTGLLLGFVLILSSCASKFQPQEGNFGYHVFASGEGRYRIEYFDAELANAKQHFNEAAKLACSGDFTTRYTGEHPVETGSYLVPIAGTNQRFSSYMQIVEGEVVCKANSKPSINIESSPWFFYGKQNEPIPVSKAYLVKRLGVNYGFLSKAEKIASTTSPGELKDIMGPATKYTELSGNSEWLFTEGYKKISVLRLGACIAKVKLAGDPLGIVVALQEKRRAKDEPENFDTYLAPEFYYLVLNKDC